MPAPEYYGNVLSALQPAANVTYYGATGNGISDDTAAIQSAITAAGASPATSTVFLPAGTYKITSTLNFTSTTSIQFKGQGHGATILKPSAGISTVLNMVNASCVEIADLEIQHPTSHTDTSIHIEQCYMPRLNNIRISNGYNCIDIGNDANANGANFDLKMRTVLGACINTGSGITIHRGGNAWYATDCFFEGTHSTGNTTTSSLGLACVTTYPIDTISLENCGFYGFYHDFYVGAGAYLYDLFFVNCLFDGAIGECWYIVPTAGGTFSSSVFTNCYIHSDNLSCLYLGPGISDGVIYDIDFIGCTFPAAGTYGVNIAGNRVRRTRFVRCHMDGSTNGGIYVQANCGSDDSSGPIEFLDCGAYTAGVGSSPYGVYLSAGANNIRIKGGYYGASTNPFYLGMGLNGCGALNIYIKDADGFGGTGGITSYGPIVAGATTNYGTVAVPAWTSGVWTNPFPADVDVYVTGGSGLGDIYVGTGTGASQKIQTNINSGYFHVPWKGTMTLTYSTAPTTVVMLAN